MIIQKYPQSHLVIKGQKTKIIIDPGFVTFEQGFKPENFSGAQGFLITHIHKDHIDYQNFKDTVKEGKVYGNPDVIALARGLGIENFQIVTDREKFTIGEFEIEAINLPHCKMADGSDGPCNTGFVINGVFFHPGDGVELDNFNVDNLALPIAGPSIDFDRALNFARSLKVKLVIPIHYDTKAVDLVDFNKKAQDQNLEVRILQNEEELTI